MFVVSLIYKRPIAEVEAFIPEHIKFLDKYYTQDKFIFSGRKNPRVGGVILAYNLSRPELEELLTEDPFYRNQIAEYDITEVIPTKYAKAFECFV